MGLHVPKLAGLRVLVIVMDVLDVVPDVLVAATVVLDVDLLVPEDVLDVLEVADQDVPADAAGVRAVVLLHVVRVVHKVVLLDAQRIAPLIVAQNVVADALRIAVQVVV